MRIVSFINQAELIRKILPACAASVTADRQHLVYGKSLKPHRHVKQLTPIQNSEASKASNLVVRMAAEANLPGSKYHSR